MKEKKTQQEPLPPPKKCRCLLRDYWLEYDSCVTNPFDDILLVPDEFSDVCYFYNIFPKFCFLATAYRLISEGTFRYAIKLSVLMVVMEIVSFFAGICLNLILKFLLLYFVICGTYI